MVLSTRRGSRRASRPRLGGPRGPAPSPAPEPSPGSAAPPAPQPGCLHCGTPSPPLRSVPPREETPASTPRAAPTPDLVSRGSGGPRGAGLPGDGGSCAPRPLQCAPRSPRSAALGGARARRRRRELLSKVLQASRPRPPLGRLRRRRAPAPARTSAASLSGARAAHALARADLVSPGSRGRRGCQHERRAVRAEMWPRA